MCGVSYLVKKFCFILNFYISSNFSPLKPFLLHFITENRHRYQTRLETWTLLIKFHLTSKQLQVEIPAHKSNYPFPSSFFAIPETGKQREVD